MFKNFNQIYSINSDNKNIIDKGLKYLFLFFKLIFLIIILYFIYNILFKGYPRFLTNLFQFKFNHKENITTHLNNSLIEDHINFLHEFNDQKTGIILKNIYNFDKINDIKYYITNIKQSSNVLMNSFEEFFIFSNIINKKDDNFYNILSMYLIQTGEINKYDNQNKEKSPNTLIEEVKSNKKNFVKKIDTINNQISLLSDILYNLVDNINKFPVIFFIKLEHNEKIIKELNLSWDIIKNKLPIYSTNEDSYIKAFLNLDEKQKITFTEKMKWNNIKLFDFFREYPIFTYVYFSNINDKKIFYYKLIETYKILYNKEKNIIEGYKLKEFVMTCVYLNLYLRNYRADISRIYLKQYLSADKFFEELTKPIIEDLFEEKIMKSFRKTFSKKEWDDSYVNFMKHYKNFGDTLTKHASTMFKKFFTSNKIENPKEPKIQQ